MAIIDLKDQIRRSDDSRSEPGYFSSQVGFARRFYRHGMTGESTGKLPDPPKPSAEPTYRVVAGGVETCLPGYRVERVDFPYWGLEFVSGGRGRVMFRDRWTDLKPGSVFAYSPGCPHRITADAVYPLKKYFVDFLPSSPAPASFSVLAQLLDGRILHSHSPEALRRSFDDLAEFGPGEGSENDRICAAQVDLLLLKIRENSAETDLAESTAYQSFRRCRDLMDSRFIEFDGIDRLAEAANMDVSYLCRLFKRYGDETPYRRLSRLRMNHAAGLLVREEYSVKRTAAELGYDDAFTFSRRFKTVMGISPRTFVRNTAEETEF